MRNNHFRSRSARVVGGALCAALVLGATACSASEDAVEAASAGTTPTTPTRPTTTQPAVVYRDLTAYEFSVCWRNEDGSIGFPIGASVPGPTALIGDVRLYVPFDLDGNRLTDVETFTRCSLAS